MDKNDNQSVFVWFVIWLLIGVYLTRLFIAGGIINNQSNAVQTPELKYETVSIYEASDKCTFRVNRITEVYDMVGHLNYEVVFRVGSTDNRFSFTCIIPDEYTDKLDKEAVYEGIIQYSYAKEPYEELVKAHKYSSILEAVKALNYENARVVNGISFVFSSYIQEGSFEDKETIENNLITQFKKVETT